MFRDGLDQDFPYDCRLYKTRLLRRILVLVRRLSDVHHFDPNHHIDSQVCFKFTNNHLMVRKKLLITRRQLSGFMSLFVVFGPLIHLLVYIFLDSRAKRWADYMSSIGIRWIILHRYKDFYYYPVSHTGPFMFGILTSFVLHRAGDRSKESSSSPITNSVIKHLLLLTSLGAMLCCYTLSKLSSYRYFGSGVMHIVIQVWQHYILAASMSFIVYSCATGSAGNS